MATQRPADFNQDLLDDFRQEAYEGFNRCEQLLIDLERTPTDPERLRQLFRQVHSFKGNLGYVGLERLNTLPQALEDVLDQLREGRLTFDSLLGDIMLLILDRLRDLVRGALAGEPGLPPDTLPLAKALSSLAQAPGQRQTEMRQALLFRLDPNTRLTTPQADPVTATGALTRHGLSDDPDLAFFLDLMQAAERRSHYWLGRGERQLEVALAMNRRAGHPVDPRQLATAVCLHDLGMALMPLPLLHKAERLTREERRLMQAHPRMGADLLRRLPQWDEAAEIILQHQEHADGSGYPKGLREAEIVPGALILNIVDTFDARTHERAHQTLSKRPVLRAILEINGLAGSQFSAHWVEVFNACLGEEPHLTRL
ncbi:MULTISPECIES: HD domain-containing phosphohydrolase [Pseudomonadaceae]|uniref:HD domain-containing phosphohydrolase n=1 Tax=Pseudomonadaceae TaxID=135621 RepID=UPI0011525A67|nr:MULTISPECIES: HD domain-containing phosphohydrolase [Pseudomonas]MCP1620783.1 HD-GYP domain-containing protein (c-di-GMP phosphodiesterase class II) [Pseudomonas otitidis]TQL09991.1 metal dependent phosphohydrolase [Pseudomonas sp. SLBN-26]WIF66287.1 HD domain-containing phosphohydrolase [Pseudomonas otitidis]